MSVQFFRRRKLGEGAEAVVWVASLDGEEVALKEFHPLPEVDERFHYEVDMLKRAGGHPNIIAAKAVSSATRLDI